MEEEIKKALAELTSREEIQKRAKPKKLNKFSIKEWGRENGWELDRWGHLKRGKYRLKLQSKSVRLEVKSSTGWVRIRSNYYCNLKIVNNKLEGLKF